MNCRKDVPWASDLPQPFRPDEGGALPARKRNGLQSTYAVDFRLRQAEIHYARTTNLAIKEDMKWPGTSLELLKFAWEWKSTATRAPKSNDFCRGAGPCCLAVFRGDTGCAVGHCCSGEW